MMSPYDRFSSTMSMMCGGFAGGVAVGVGVTVAVGDGVGDVPVRSNVASAAVQVTEALSVAP